MSGSKRSIKIIVFLAVAIPVVAYLVHKVIIHIKAYRALTFQYSFDSYDSSVHGFLLLSPYIPTQQSFSNLIIIDAAGHKVLNKRVDGIVGDFRQWNIDSRIYYSYSVYDPAIFLQNYANGSVAHQVILDTEFKEIRQVHLLPHGDIKIYNHQGLNHHDFIMLGSNHFVTMAAYVKQVNNIPDSLSPSPWVKLAVPIIQEVKDNKVIWQWDASSYPEFYTTSNKGNNFADSSAVQDYLHINSIFIDPADSNLIVSFHNADQVVKLNRASGEIIWRLGGKYSDFQLTKEQHFFRQHNATIIDSGHTLLLFDNGDSTKRAGSRVLEFKLNEQTKTIDSFISFSVPEPFSQSKGSVQLIGDNYLICGGSANYALLVNRHTGTKKIELHYSHTSFRAYWVSQIGLAINQQKID